MIVIAHRGNLHGPSSAENSPQTVERALGLGFDAEVDVWLVNGSFWLGHDKPTYLMSGDWLQRPGLWCHAKNVEALVQLRQCGVHHFWHENDNYTLTSRGVLWCYPGNYHSQGIAVMLDDSVPQVQVLGVCTDYAVELVAVNSLSCTI